MDWLLNYSVINMYSYYIIGGMFWSLNCLKIMWYMSFIFILVCFLCSILFFGFSKMIYDMILVFLIVKKDNIVCYY